MSVIRFLHRGYKLFVSPLLVWISGPGGGCRFEPSCSEYAVQAVERHGVLRGSWLGARRLCRCHPWGGAGFDPVPPLNPGRHNLKTDIRSAHATH